MEVDKLHSILVKTLNDKKRIIIKWKNGLKIRGKVDTSYETDNGLEMDEKEYAEYYACAIDIEEVMGQPYSEKDKVKEGNLIEVSIQNEPLYVSLDNGEIIWASDN